MEAFIGGFAGAVTLMVIQYLIRKYKERLVKKAATAKPSEDEWLNIYKDVFRKKLDSRLSTGSILVLTKDDLRSGVQPTTDNIMEVSSYNVSYDLINLASLVIYRTDTSMNYIVKNRWGRRGVITPTKTF